MTFRQIWKWNISQNKIFLSILDWAIFLVQELALPRSLYMRRSQFLARLTCVTRLCANACSKCTTYIQHIYERLIYRIAGSRTSLLSAMLSYKLKKKEKLNFVKSISWLRIRGTEDHTWSFTAFFFALRNISSLKKKKEKYIRTIEGKQKWCKK